MADIVEHLGSLHVADGDGWTPWQPGVQPLDGDDRTLLGVDKDGGTHLLRWIANEPGTDPVWWALAWEIRGQRSVPIVHAIREENTDLIVAWRFA